METIDLLIPCPNEAESAEALIQALDRTIDGSKQPSKVAIGFELIIVDDGSTVQTCQHFEQLIRQSPSISGGSIISLGRNFRKEAAIVAGLDHYKGDACINLNANLQDPPALIREMITA